MPALSTTATFPSSSSSSTISSKKRRRGRPSHEEIKKNLALLSEIPRPLSPTLPPSPPQSRSSSPAPPASKRRRIGEHSPPSIDSKPATGPTPVHPVPLSSLPKRPGFTTLAAASPKNIAKSPLRNVSKDDRLASSSPASSTAASSSSKPTSPIPRPPARPQFVRKKRIMSPSELNGLANEYSTRARTLKRSGEARVGPSSRPDARTTLIGLLEMTEGLVEFTYQFWLGDESSRRIHASNWSTILGLVNACRGRWKESATTERQRAIIGLILLIEGCVYSRTSSVRFNEMSRVMNPPANSPSPAPPPPPSSLPHGAHHSSAMNSRAGSHPTPPALISPEPSPQASSGAGSSTSSPSPLGQQQHLQPHLPSAPDVWEIARGAQHSARRINEAHAILSPAVLSRHFPLTWSRCIRSALTVGEGHDVYPEACTKPHPFSTLPSSSSSSSSSMVDEGDEPAAWCWPPTSGEHIVHVVGMAKSMLWELARAEVTGVPYKGANGVNTQY